MGYDSNPNQFDYDILYKNIPGGMKSLLLSPGTLPAADDAGGFVVAIEVNGWDIANN